MNESMRMANKAHQRWRLFQIAFIVSLLPELASREYPALKREDDGRVDLLWFAAGGGKTEAFMGIILWQAFFDRLRGKRFGNTAFVRFPLRLLTFQQLQRLSRTLACAEVVRKNAGFKGARFSIGYFVGSTVTPNSISPEMHQRFSRQGVDPKYKRIFVCPLCAGPVTLLYNEPLKLIEHHCATKTCSAASDRLPVYVTDQDIYRYLPTVIVSTVDKLALLGQNQRFSNLFGRVDLICGDTRCELWKDQRNLRGCCRIQPRRAPEDVRGDGRLLPAVSRPSARNSRPRRAAPAQRGTRHVRRPLRNRHHRAVQVPERRAMEGHRRNRNDSGLRPASLGTLISEVPASSRRMAPLLTIRSTTTLTQNDADAFSWGSSVWDESTRLP